MDYYQQIFCRFRKCKQKVPPPSPLSNDFEKSWVFSLFFKVFAHLSAFFAVAPKFSDTLTLSQPGGQILPTIAEVEPKFFPWLHPCMICCQWITSSLVSLNFSTVNLHAQDLKTKHLNTVYLKSKTAASRLNILARSMNSLKSKGSWVKNKQLVKDSWDEHQEIYGGHP